MGWRYIKLNPAEKRGANGRAWISERGSGRGPAVLIYGGQGGKSRTKELDRFQDGTAKDQKKTSLREHPELPLTGDCIKGQGEK